MSIPRRLELGLSVLIAALTPALAQAQTGSITGTITTAVANPPSVTVYDSVGRIAGQALGSPYTVSGLTAGTYYVVASAAGNVSELYDDIVCVAADCVPQHAGAGVVVTAGGTTSANFALSAGGGIQGTVRRASDSTAIGSVTVFLYNAATSLVATTTTATGGTYSFTGLPSGSYYLRVGAPALSGAAHDYVQELYGGVICPVIGTGFACRIAQGTLVSVVGGATTGDIDFSLDHGARINGQVTLGGTPVPNVTVRAYSGGVPVAAAATSDSNGFYTVQGLPAGAYNVRADPSTAATPNLVEIWYNNLPVAYPIRPAVVTLAAGAAVTGINFPLSAGGSIAGTVTYADPLLAALPPNLEVYSPSGLLVKSQAVGAGSPASYTIAGLPAGNYYLKLAASHPQARHVDQLFNGILCVAVDCLPSSGTPVSVAVGAQTSNIDFSVQAGAMIAGSSPPGSIVDVYDSRGVLLVRPSARDIIPAGPAGTVDRGHIISGLPSGTYYLVLRRQESTSTPSQLFNGYACDGCAVTFGTPVVVTAGAAQSVLASFTTMTGGTIEGNVTDGVTPLSTIGVEVYNASGALVASTTTSAGGFYRVPALAPGKYYVRTVNTRGYVDQLYDSMTCAECSPLLGTQVTVAASAATPVNFVLGTGVAIGGTIRADVGGVLPGTGVSIFTSTGTKVAEAVTDAFGRYTAVVNAGSYRARTDPSPGWIQELYNNLACASGTCDVTTGTAVNVVATPVTNIDFGLAFCSGRVISPARLATAAVGIAYTQTLATTGSQVPASRRFAISGGALPPGLTLDAVTGVISGTPTATGAYPFTVSVTDTAGCVGSREYTLDVPACAFNLAATTASLRAAGESTVINLTNTCGTVTAAANDSWIAVDSVSASSVTITAAANTLATARTGTVSIGPRVFTVFQSGTTTAPPFGTVDTPIDGSSANGSIPVTGWALDDLGVSRVDIYRDPVGAEAPGVPVYIGQATFVTGARPDVEAVYPSMPFANRAGWGYLLLTNMLPNQGNGTFRLLAYAIDADGAATLLGAKTFVGNNASAISPFGAIDTPTQGATISGSSFINFGWALTPQPKIIPFNGSTIIVYIDGAPTGPVTQYNLFRSDVSNLFPNLTNSGGPVGFRTLDTTALAEGVHTISWVATDNLGQATGIGSRYFTVNNSAWRPSVKQADAELRPDPTVVPSRVGGPDLGRQSASLSLLPVTDARVVRHLDEHGGEAQDVDVTETGQRVVTVKELERVELSLGSVDGCAASYAGYTLARGEVRDLPIGASLDAAGRFYWQTAPGFIGRYRLVFVRTACDGGRERIPVTVVIMSK